LKSEEYKRAGRWPLNARSRPNVFLMQAPADSLVARLLRRLAAAVCRYPRWIFFPQVLLLVASVFYTVFNLEFSMDRNALVGADKRYHRIFLEFLDEFAAQADLVAVVESEDQEKNRQFVERLGARLEQETDTFTDVFYKGDLKMMGPKALLFLPEDTLKELEETLRDFRPFIEQFAQATSLNALFRQINQQFRSARRQENGEALSMLKALPALTRIVQQTTASLHRPGMPPSPGINALFNAEEEAEEQQYITFAKGRIYVVSTRAKSHSGNGVAVERLRHLVEEVQAEVPGINAGVTGEPVLEYDEMLQSQKDSTVASVMALGMVALIFGVAYRQVGRPLKATAALVFGLAYTMAYTTFAVGHLNILTVTFLPILIGLAIDFGIHLITRYEEELRAGRSQHEAIEKALVYTGQGIFTGCFTTAGAFFAMALTDFRGIQEMGIITGGGILICLVPMMTVLPVLLLHGRPTKLGDPHAFNRRARIERIWLGRPGLIAGLTAVLVGLAVSQFRHVYFDYNLLNMQSHGLAAVEFEHKLINSASRSVLYAAVVADSLEEALSLEKRVRKLPAVGSVDSMSQFLAEDQSAKVEGVRQIKSNLQEIEFAEIDPSVNPADLAQTLFYTQSYLGLAIAEAEKAEAGELVESLRELRESIVNLRFHLTQPNGRNDAARLAAFQLALFRDVHETFGALRHQHADTELRMEDLPTALRNRFVGQSGKHLLQVYPRENIWQREHQEEFIRQLRSVDENVTGTPVQLFEYTTLLKESYQNAAWYSLGAIALLVFVHFRRPLSVVLALLPVGIGTTWMVGLMGWLDIPFNPANIMTLPLVIGIGVTNGIHILNRFSEEGNPGLLAKSTGKAVLVSGLTTMAGFSSLISADHQGIASLGMVMSIGVAMCMIAALTFLPAVLTLLLRCGYVKRPGVGNAQATPGREEPR
jgi:uncharacterized protein